MDELYLVGVVGIIAGLLGALIVFVWFKFTPALTRGSLEEKNESQTMIENRDKKRILAVFRTIELYANATIENEILEIFLQTSLQMSSASGVTYVPLDKRELPLNSIIRGNLPHPSLNAWIEYLASPSVRDTCGTCEQYHHQISECHLLNYQFMEKIGSWNIGSVYCIPIASGYEKFGILNLYLDEGEKIDDELESLFRILSEVTALYIQALRTQKLDILIAPEFRGSILSTEISRIISSIVDIIKTTLTAEFVIFRVGENAILFEGEQFISGTTPVSLKSEIIDLMIRVDKTKQVIISNDIFKESSNSSGINSLIGLPIIDSEGYSLGIVLAGIKDYPSIAEGYLSFLREFANHLSVIYKKVAYLSLLEYKSTLQERGRIAREIHDGLAQTLGYLKLQTAQMIGYLDEGENIRARRKLDDCYQLLSDAYDDTREAIDNLKADVTDQDINKWLVSFGQEFRNITGFDVFVDCDKLPDVLSPERNSQLIRIVQEALSNVRKHSNGKNVWLTCQLNNNALFLEIRDDGVGFLPEDIRSVSRHGIKGMMERAELIGADFQIQSNDQVGTRVQIMVPVGKVARERG